MNRKPIIRRSSFWADVINMLGFRRVWRVTPPDNNGEQ